MSDFDYDLSDPTTGVAAPRRKKAAPATAGGVAPEQFAKYLADPTTIPEGFKGFTPQQDRDIRKAWPILTRETHEGDAQRSELLKRTLDPLLTDGETLYRTPLDKKTHNAIVEHFGWVRRQERKTEGAGAELAGLFASAEDPLDKLKGDRKERALQAIRVIEKLRTAGTEPGAQGASPLDLLTTHIPSAYDSPNVVEQKRRSFAQQIEGLAQSMPSQEWRTAIKHTLRARALGGVPTSATAVTKPAATPATPPVDFPFSGHAGGAPAPAAVPATAPAPDKIAPYGLTGVITGQMAPAEEMGIPEAVGRAALHGATSLSMPVMAAVAHAMSISHAAPTGVPGLSVPTGTEEPEVSLKDAATAGRQFIGDDPAKLAQAHEEHPVASFIGETAGGFADPSTYALGPLTAPVAEGVGAAARLSPAARAVLAHAMAGGVAGGASAAGEGGDAGIGALTGAMAGGVLGKVGEKLLESPAHAKVIKGVVQNFADKTGANSAEVAAKEAAVRSAAMGSPEMRAVVSGHKPSIEALAPKLVDARDALLGKMPNGKAWRSSVVKAEEAIDAGDAKGAEAAHAQLRKLARAAGASAAQKELAEGLDELLTKREILAHAKSGGHHGNVSQYSANVHPMATLANPEASVGAQGAAAVHEGMVRGAGSLPMLAVAGARRLLRAPARSVQQGLAKLYIARQTGDKKLIHEVAEEAIRVGVPYSLARQVAEQAAQPGEGDE